MEDRFRFRYWDKQINKMRTGDILMGSNGIPYIIGMDTGKPIVQEIDDVEPMQCTALRDKKGKLIYEGDILQIYKNAKFPVIVRWNLTGGEFYMYGDCFIKNFTEIPQMELEIMGNIYENPELLKGGEE